MQLARNGILTLPGSCFRGFFDIETAVSDIHSDYCPQLVSSTTKYVSHTKTTALFLTSAKRASSFILPLTITRQASCFILLVKQRLHILIAKAIEYMLTDALLEADKHMNIAGRVLEAESFMHLTDYIIEEIKQSRDPVSLSSLSSVNPLLTKVFQRNLQRQKSF